MGFFLRLMQMDRLTLSCRGASVPLLVTEAKGRSIIGNPVSSIHQDANLELYPQLYMVDADLNATGQIMSQATHDQSGKAVSIHNHEPEDLPM